MLVNVTRNSLKKCYFMNSAGNQQCRLYSACQSLCDNISLNRMLLKILPFNRRNSAIKKDGDYF